ncbi:MAG: helix-turn-helix transcriptional regulator [Lachnospiraceae bacterium]
MNETALMQYLSYNLHTIIRRYNEKHELINIFCARHDLNERLLDPSELSEHFFTYLKNIDKDDDIKYSSPFIFSINHMAVYTLVCVPDGFFLVGPTRFKSGLEPINKLMIEDYPKDILDFAAEIEYSFYAKQVLLLRNLYYTKQTTEEGLLHDNFRDTHNPVQKDYSRRIFQGLENKTKHNPYDQEVREQTSIEQGDLKGLKESIAEDYHGDLGVLSVNPLRNIKNLGIVVITLASRSAIKGGVLPEVAFSLSDSYIQQLENVQDESFALQLTRNAEYQYCKMVNELKEKKKGVSKRKNPYIEQSKAYIFSHLHDKITVEELAAELCVNANYLSSLFKKHQGVSLSHYILEEKINRAKNLLTYSDYSYIDIASYLGFSSQSHFSVQFKNITGYTPKAYRDEFGIKEE